MAAARRDAPAHTSPAHTAQAHIAQAHIAVADIAALVGAAWIAAGPSHWRGPSQRDQSGRSDAPVPRGDRYPPSGHADLCRDHSHHGRENVGPDIDQPSPTMHPLSGRSQIVRQTNGHPPDAADIPMCAAVYLKLLRLTHTGR